MKPIKVREILLGKGIRLFTLEEFRRIFNKNPHQVKYFLESQTKEGLLARLKKGIYALRTDLPNEEEIANKLYYPSYISFEYALGYYGLIPEMSYMVTSATTKPTRLFTVNNVSYKYRSIKTEAYGGYILKKNENYTFLIAEPEKALVDYLYFVALKNSSYNERLMRDLTDRSFFRTKGLRKNLIKQYASLYQFKGLDRFVATLI